MFCVRTAPGNLNQHLCIQLRNATTSIKLNHVKLKTVKLAYASYESTKPITGESPSPMIVIHGLFGSKANWNGLSKAFLEKTVPQRKIFAIDARNHGDSPHIESHTYREMAEDVKELMNTLNIKKACLLGHSMGGRIAMMFALKYPELVDKLIVGDSSPLNNSAAEASTNKVIDALMALKMPPQEHMSNAKAYIDAQLAKKIRSKGLRAFLLTNLVVKPGGSFKWRVNMPVLTVAFKSNIMQFPNITDAKYTGPTLFVCGSNSDYVPKTDHPNIQKLFPTAEFQYIDGAGHWLHSEKPAQFLRTCLDFLNK